MLSSNCKNGESRKCIFSVGKEGKKESGKKQVYKNCIQIKNFFFFRINLPGHYYELNVHFGIFVGGMGNFNELFLGNRENFRGCLDSVFFNGRDVLSQAKVSINIQKLACLER